MHQFIDRIVFTFKYNAYYSENIWLTWDTLYDNSPNNTNDYSYDLFNQHKLFVSRLFIITMIGNMSKWDNNLLFVFTTDVLITIHSAILQFNHPL